MKITPLSAGFGARIENLDLNRASVSDAAALRAALVENGLLHIPGQEITPPQQIAASRIFGELETFPCTRGQLAGMPEIFRVASRPEDGHVEVGRYWHSDGSFREVPTPITIWSSVVAPPAGGETLFTDLRAAYDALEPELRGRLEGLRTMHRNGVVHDLVLRHPVTGEPGLYLNMGLTAAMLDVDAAESANLMRIIDRHFSRPGATYAHVWQSGDVVVADNLRVAHKATPIAPRERRILNRTTIRSDAVRWS